MEGTFSRMFDMGKSELLLGRILSLRILSEIDMVSMEDMENLRCFNKYNIILHMLVIFPTPKDR